MSRPKRLVEVALFLWATITLVFCFKRCLKQVLVIGKCCWHLVLLMRRSGSGDCLQRVRSLHAIALLESLLSS